MHYFRYTRSQLIFDTRKERLGTPTLTHTTPDGEDFINLIVPQATRKTD